MFSIRDNARFLIAAAALIFVGFTTSIHAKTGDAVSGEEKAGLCGGCHGIDGNSADSATPRLAGQYAGYIAKQIQDFKKGHRNNNETMAGMALSVASSQDAWDIGVYFQQQVIKGALTEPNKELAAQGENIYRNGNLKRGVYGCINCHGESGKGKSKTTSAFPVIGGQHRDYIIKQLNDFRSGGRKNDPAGMMSAIAEKLTEKEINALAEYLSSQL